LCEERTHPEFDLVIMDECVPERVALVEHGLVYRSADEIEFFSPFFRTCLLAQEL